MICSVCQIHEAQNHPHIGLLPCVLCQNRQNEVKINYIPTAKTLAQANRIQRQREHFEKDILQPWDGQKPNPEFIRANDRETVEKYFDREQLEKADV